jgi:DNA-directed RNA polymerase specialized sigma24 family protein
LRSPFQKEDQQNKPRLAPEAPGDALDRELARGILRGDREALARLLDRHLGPVYGYVVRRLGPGHDDLAWEVATATFEEAMRDMKRYATGSPSRPMRLWLLNIAGRHLARRARSYAANPAPEMEGGRLLRLRRAMNALSPRKQAAFSLALVEELPPDELAGALGVGLPRAMRILRSALKDAGKALAAAPGEASRG